MFDPCFRDFDDFRDALNHDYRKQFNKSQRKFAAAGLRTEIITDVERILQVYTPQVHALYEAVERQAHHRFEQLPAEFFRALARQFPGQVSLVAAWRGSRVVGFLWDFMHRGVFCNLFIGLDYAVNAEADLYFNLMMQNLDYCLRQKPTQIFVGQTADQFKSRLGCYQRERYYFVKARGWPLKVALCMFRRILFPPSPPPKPQPHLFKQRRTVVQGPAST